jgi:ankyrin repeat protein
MKRGILGFYFVSMLVLPGFSSAFAADSEDENSTNLNELDESGQSPLMKAAQAGQIDEVKRLLSAGASLTICNKKGLNVLHYAAESANAELLTFLITEKGMPVDSFARGAVTSLHRACITGQLSSIKTLLDLGANLDTLGMFLLPNAGNKGTALNPLGCALYKNRKEAIEFIVSLNNELLDKAIDLSLNNCWAGALETLTLFNANRVREKINNRHQKFSERTWYEAVHLSLTQNWQDMLQTLVDGRQGLAASALIKAVIYGKNLLAVQFLLVHYHLDFRMTDENNFSLLHHAAKSGSKELIDFLLAMGLNPSAINAAFQMPVHVACGTGNLEGVKVLMPYFRSTRSPLQVRLLRQVDLAVPRTPLEVAQQNKSSEVIKYLMGWTEAAAEDAEQ